MNDATVTILYMTVYLPVPGLSFGTKNLQLPHANSEFQHVGSSSPTRKSNLGPLYWERGVVATGPPGKSQEWQFKKKKS